MLLRPKQKRHSRSSISEGEESGTDSSTSVKDVKSKRVYSPKKHMSVSPSKHASKSKPYQIATLDVSPTFLETSPSDEVKTELKDYLEDAIRNQFIMTLGEIKEMISETHLSNLCNHSDFEKIIDEALLSCGAQKLKNKVCILSYSVCNCVKLLLLLLLHGNFVFYSGHYIQHQSLFML